MVRTFKSNDKGTNELKAQAADQSNYGRSAAEQSGAPAARSGKKVWDCYLNTDTGYGENKKESQLIATFEIKAGRSKANDTPYFMLTGFSKELGGVNIGLTKKVDKIVEQLVDAGFDTVICDVLEKKGILK